MALPAPVISVLLSSITLKTVKYLKYTDIARQNIPGLFISKSDLYSTAMLELILQNQPLGTIITLTGEKNSTKDHQQ